MKNKKNLRTAILAAAALTMTAGAGAGGAMAYFTAYATAQGSVRMDMGFTEIEPMDRVDSAGKHAGVENIGAYDCFARMKVISDIPVDYHPGEGWRDGNDGFWYYDGVLKAGASTSELLITYELPKGEKADPLNIIILPECTPVLYEEDGTPVPDWTHTVMEKETE